MRTFIELFESLDQTNKTNDKLDALVNFFEKSDRKDALWAIALLTGKRPRRLVKTVDLRRWAAREAQISDELFEDCYHVVGDLAETITLLLPPGKYTLAESLSEVIDEMMANRDQSEEEKKELVLKRWYQLDISGRFVFNKLITGGFRVGVSRKLVTKALARYLQTEESAIAHRLMGNWSPNTATFDQLLLHDDPKDDLSKPYPFYLAYPLEDERVELNPNEWQAEYKWDGIRGQFIVREGAVFLWSRGEELITDRFPEIETLRAEIPEGTVLDGEVMAWNHHPLPFQTLQKRIGRKNVTPSLMKKIPAIFMAYDVLEYGGEDIRQTPLSYRREKLEELGENVRNSAFQISKQLKWSDFTELREIQIAARKKYAEGLMLKRTDSIYRDGRKRGDWWKWKLEPLTIDAVMIYAQRGHGRRANLYTDFTFAVWNGDELVPFAKAYSGLSDAELKKVDRFVKQHTLERFGPVRSVSAELVFEIAFEGIVKSNRHKSGIALRFPRIKRWRTDKSAKEANSLADLKALLEVYGPQ